jgi:uncharacterized protein with LGFP repeats
VFGAIAAVWSQMGAEKGRMGYPTAEMVCATAACSQLFQGGFLVWSVAGGTHATNGSIGGFWAANGGLANPVGVPTGDITCPSGCSQPFSNGLITWDPTAGAHAISGPVLTAWTAAGGAAGALGYPTSDPYPVAGGTAQNFRGGRLTLDTATQAVTRS